jgi:hypothetical protein
VRQLALITAAAGVASCGGSPSVPGASSPGVAAVAPSSTGISLPPVDGRFSYQLGGAYPPAPGVSVVSRDRSDPPAPGVYSICYVNAFQAQPDAIGWWRRWHPDLLLRNSLGQVVLDRQWQEPLLDIATAGDRSRLLSVVGSWIDGCAKAGFQAIEADNLDSYTRSEGELTGVDAVAFARQLALRAHQDHLAIAQKNAAELSRQVRGAGFDFALAEECQVYAECDAYTAVYGRHVVEVEYADESVTFFRQACAARGQLVSIVRRDRDLLPVGQVGHVEQWCP